MVKGHWVVGAFLGGVTLGVVATRMTYDAPTINAVESIETRTTPRVLATDDPTLAARVTPPARPVPPLPTSGGMNARVATPAPDNVAAALPNEGDAGAAIAHIDAGEVFNKVIARQPQPGFENQIGDAHRELERETRDDGWSYPMEAEIQNSMVNEVSTGAFRAEHVECRATLCEVRLSAKGEQGEALKRWSEGLGKQPFGQRLFLNYSSSISNNDKVDMLMVFRRPPRTN